MPVPQENSLFVEQASCLFIKNLLRMVQYLSKRKVEGRRQNLLVRLHPKRSRSVSHEIVLSWELKS
ncbi:hypothetical protein QUA00_30150 [Microcoleus sp. T2B6]|uniref:hypothetical protein n=1 Tax=Microcoleus sp. T2B6 TaxID=3055424 RepID=UPI002FCE9967